MLIRIINSICCSVDTGARKNSLMITGACRSSSMDTGTCKTIV